MEYPISYLIVTVLVGLVVPIYSMLGNGEKIKELISESPELKISMYVQSIIFQWIMVGLILLSLFYNGDSVDKIGLDFLNEPLMVLGLFGGGLLSLWVFDNYDIPKLDLEKFKRSPIFEHL